MSNEGKVCDAAVKSIEQRTGEDRKDIRLPEKNHVGPPVELRLKIGTQEYAIEHTQIEAFEDEIGKGVSLVRLAGPVEKALCGKLPGPAIYTMSFPPDCVLSVSKSNLKKHQEKLAKWVLENALLLYGKIQGRIGGKAQDSITAKPCGFQYEIRLSCLITGVPSDQKPGCLGAGRWAPEGLEALTKRRLRRALCKKLPKLLDCKGEGARTVLVLESDDLITDANLVGNALADLQGEFTRALPFPDEIYFVKTASSEGPWSVWLLKYDSQRWSWEDLTKFTTFRVDELADLTRMVLFPSTVAGLYGKSAVDGDTSAAGSAPEPEERS